MIRNKDYRIKYPLSLKLIITIVTILLITILSLGIINFIDSRNMLKERILSDMEALAKSKAQQITCIVGQDFERTALVASRTKLRECLVDIQTKGIKIEENRNKMIKILMDAMESVESIKNIDVIGIKGRVIAATLKKNISKNMQDTQFFVRGRKDFYLGEMFLSNNKFMHSVSAPMYDPRRREKRVIGVVKVDLEIKRIINTLNDYTGLGKTGEILLVKRVDDNILFLNPLRHEKNAEMKLLIPLHSEKVGIIALAAKGKQGLASGLDYRGMKTLNAYRHVAVGNWGLIVKTDIDEAFLPIRQLETKILFAGIVILIIGVLVVFLLARYISRPIEELHKATEVLTAGNLDYQVKINTRDEIGKLAESFNQMVKNLKRVTRALKTLSESNEALVRITNESELLKNICTIITETGKYPLVWVGLMGNEEKILPVAQGGYKNDYLKTIESTWIDIEKEKNPVRRAIRTGKYSIVKNIPAESDYELWKDEAIELGYVSLIVLPLINEKEKLGVLSIYSNEVEAFGKDEVKLLKELANDLAYSIATLRIKDKHRQAEESRQESEERYRDLVETTDDLVQSVTPDGQIVYVNRAWQEALGYSEEEARKLSIFEIIHPDSKEHCMEIFGRVIAGEKVDNVEAKFLAKDGRAIEVEGSANCRFVGGKPVATYGIFHDVTKRKQAEKEKDELQSQLLQAQKMEAIGILAGGVAHDFNNLLTTILGNTQMIMSEIDKESTMYDDLKEITTATSRATSLIRQLLLFSRKQPMGFTPLNINRIINDLLKMLQRLIGEDIIINKELESELWNAEVDETNIEQVITNLVVNAKDAMPKGGKITIKTENVTLDEEQCKSIHEAYAGKFVRLSIEDTGIGMDKEIIQHIFEPFFSTKEPGKGTGLGLSVIYGIVKQHNGWVNVYSEPGKGSIFKVYLPAVSLKAKEKPKEKVSPDKLEGKGERILIVEDEESIRKLVKRIFENNNYVVFTAGNAKEAMEIFEKEKRDFQLVISDMVLPDKTGLELVEELLSHKPKLRVILSSGYMDDKSKWSTIQEKGYKFLQKPYEIDVLLKTVRETLGTE